MENNELMHYGVKGQKWYVRRYQNKDGTLTAAGKKRYAKEMDKLKKEEAILKNKQRTKAQLDKLEEKRKSIEEQKKALEGKKTEDTPKADPKPEGKKSAKDMSDEELNAIVNRMRNEKAYNDLYTELNPKTVSKGKKFVQTVTKSVVAPAATEVGKAVVKNMLNKAVDSLKDEDDRKKK